MVAALVGVVAFRQEQERPLRYLGVLFRRVAAQPLEALPVDRLFGLLLALAALGFNPTEELHMLCDHAHSCCGCLDAAANHLPAFTSGFAEFILGLLHHLFPVRPRLGERVGAILLAAQIT